MDLLKKLILLSSLLPVLLLVDASAQNVSIVSEDFETGGGNIEVGNGGLSLTLTPGPVDATNTVGAADVGGTGFSGLQTSPRIQALPSGSIPGVSTFRIRMRVYLPSTTTLGARDRLGFNPRFNDDRSIQSPKYFDIAGIPRDTWHDLEVTGIVPERDSMGKAITNVRTLFLVNDRNADGTPGEDAVDGLAVYLDDIDISFSVSQDDPNLPTISGGNFGTVDQNGGAVNRILKLTNSGSLNDLEITGVTLVSDVYSLPNGPFIATLTPGQSTEILVELDPGEMLGDLSATLSIASNDPSDPITEIALTATSVEPFEGIELFANSGFETGDLQTGVLEGWVNSSSTSFSQDFARRGSGSGEITLSGDQFTLVEQQNNFNGEGLSTFEIPPSFHGQNYFLSGWYYLPETGSLTSDDEFSPIIRWNSLRDNGNQEGPSRLAVATLQRGVWSRISFEGIVPPIAFGDPNNPAKPDAPVNNVSIFWQIRDTPDASGAPDGAGLKIYFDDLSFKVEAPIEAPPVELVISDLVVNGGSIELFFPTILDREYIVESSPSLIDGSWFELADLLGTGNEESVSDPSGGPGPNFYRLRLLPQEEEPVPAP